MPRPNHRYKACILSHVEAQDFILGITPDCKDHDHCCAQEAWELCAPPWQRVKSDHHEPPAKWIGPHHIQLTQVKDWAKTYRRDGEISNAIKGPGVPVMQLVLGAPSVSHSKRTKPSNGWPDRMRVTYA